ncbi:MAG: hypothetical protein AAB602_02205 [Patescibacteria group bacterium]
MFKNFENKIGFSTIEMLIAFSFFALIIGGVSVMALSNQVVALDTQLSNQALLKADQWLETLKTTAALNWSSANSIPLSAPDSDYQQYEVFVQDISPCAKYVSSAVLWHSSPTRSQKTEYITLLTNPAEAIAMGGGCDPIPPGEWDNPGSFGSVDLSGSDGTGVDAHYINGIRYAIITADPSSASAEDFIVVDVSDPDNLDLSDIVSEIDTGPGLNGVAVGKTYAYVVQNENTDQLQVIDVSNPAAPSLVISVALPNITFSCPGGNKCLAGRSVAYYGNKVYVGTAYIANLALPSTQNNEFHIFDVSSPANPVWLGSLNVNHNVNDIEVRGNYAYLATSDDVGEMTVVDVSNPVASFVAGKFDAQATGGGASNEDGWSIDVVGSYAYFGRERVNGGTERDFYILNVSNPASVSVVGSKIVGMTSGNDIYISGIAKQGNYAFLSTTDSNEPFFVLDVADPSNPVNYSACGLNFSQVTRGLKYLDNLIFTVNRSNDILRIIYDQPTACS